MADVMLGEITFSPDHRTYEQRILSVLEEIRDELRKFNEPQKVMVAPRNVAQAMDEVMGKLTKPKARK